MGWHLTENLTLFRDEWRCNSQWGPCRWIGLCCVWFFWAAQFCIGVILLLLYLVSVTMEYAILLLENTWINVTLVVQVPPFHKKIWQTASLHYGLCFQNFYLESHVIYYFIKRSFVIIIEELPSAFIVPKITRKLWHGQILHALLTFFFVHIHVTFELSTLVVNLWEPFC